MPATSTSSRPMSSARGHERIDLMPRRPRLSTTSGACRSRHARSSTAQRPATIGAGGAASRHDAGRDFAAAGARLKKHRVRRRCAARLPAPTLDALPSPCLPLRSTRLRTCRAGDLVSRGAAELALPLRRSEAERLVAYVRLIERWNATYNLTAIRDPREMVIQHIARLPRRRCRLGRRRGAAEARV